MRILITGSHGQLGSAAVDHFTRQEYEVIDLSKERFDITDSVKIDAVLLEYHPEIILNCAAYNDVEKAGDEIEAAYRINALAPYRLALAAKKISARLIHISTDYVFDGVTDAPYTEHDCPNPVNVYGASKLAGEQLVLIADPNSVIIRTSWLFGTSRDQKMANFVAKILHVGRTKSEVKVVNDQWGVPTYTVDLVQAIEELIHRELKGGIYHIVNQGFCSRFEETEKIFTFLDIKTPLHPIETAETNPKIVRPKSTILSTEKIKALGLSSLRMWDDALREYLATLPKSPLL